jgi:hypothetical protein
MKDLKNTTENRSERELETFYENGKYGIKDRRTGKKVIPLKYDGVGDFCNGFARVKLNGKWGFIYKTGKEITPLKYDDVDYFRDGFARVKLNGKWGFIDETGKEITPLKYIYVENFLGNLAKVQSYKRTGFIDKTGKEVIPLEYAHAFFSRGLVAVNLNGKWGYVDKTGKEVIPIKYDRVWDFSGGLAVVESNWKYGLIDDTGKEIIPVKYDEIKIAYPHSLPTIRIKLNGKYGLINAAGKEITPVKYDEIGWRSNEVIPVRLDGKWGFIDKTGKEIIPLEYDGVSKFSKELAMVVSNRKLSYIDKTGKKVSFEKVFIKRKDIDHIYLLSEGLYEVHWLEPDVSGYIDECGCIDEWGNVLIPIEYNTIRELSDGKVIAIKDDFRENNPQAKIYDSKIRELSNEELLKLRAGCEHDWREGNHISLSPEDYLYTEYCWFCGALRCTEKYER